MIRKLVLSLFLFFSCLTLSNTAFSQCGAASIAVKNYCPNQYAEFTVSDPSTSNRYRWFPDNTGTNSYGYGNYSLDGKYFTSPGTIAGGSGTKTFYYQKELYDVTGGATTTTAPVSAVDPNFSNNAYSIQFTTTNAIELTQITVPVHTYYWNVGSQYRIQVQIGAAYSQWVTFGNPTGNANQGVYLIDLPTLIDALGNGMSVAAGTTATINITIQKADGTASDIKLAWFNKASIPNSYTINPGVTISQTATNQTAHTPVIYDWTLNTKCPLQSVSASEETDMTKCCTPVTQKPAIATQSGETVFASPFTDRLTATNVANPLYYRWYLDGTQLAVGSNLTPQNISKVGKYKLRVVRNSADIDKASCYIESDILVLKKRVLFANASKTNLCIGETATLTAQGAISNVSWTPTANIANQRLSLLRLHLSLQVQFL